HSVHSQRDIGVRRTLRASSDFGDSGIQTGDREERTRARTLGSRVFASLLAAHSRYIRRVGDVRSVLSDDGFCTELGDQRSWLYARAVPADSNARRYLFWTDDPALCVVGRSLRQTDSLALGYGAHRNFRALVRTAFWFRQCRRRGCVYDSRSGADGADVRSAW